MDSTLDTTLDCKLRDFEVSFGVLNPILTIGYNADETDYGQQGGSTVSGRTPCRVGWWFVPLESHLPFSLSGVVVIIVFVLPTYHLG